MQLKPTRSAMPGIVLALITTMVSLAMPIDARQRPQLVVGVMIDGLDAKYIDMLRDQFGHDGFNRLLREGVVIPNADYGTNVDATAASAMAMTGASPSTTSVTGKFIYDSHAQRRVPAMNDPQAMGNYTPQTYSPRSLGVSTLADELIIAGDGLGRVYAIAPEPAQAVIMAGHAANAAIWLDENTGNWATSTYYKDFPKYVSHRNRLKPLSARIDTMQWTPLRQPEAYTTIPEYVARHPFKHSLSRTEALGYGKFLESPRVNAEITDLAGELINNLRLGANPSQGVDMLNVAYTLQPYPYTRGSDSRYEVTDSYLRLDQDLARLFARADSMAGKGGTVFFVAATPPSGRSRRDDEKWNIPYGEFSTKKAKSLLNMYLIARYGNGEWIKGYYNDQFFLNNKLIDDRGLDPHTVRLEAAAFLEKMSGVDRVHTVDEILAGRGDSHFEALQRNTHAASSGDLFVEITPGWETVDDILTPANSHRVHYVKRVAPATAPLFIMAPDVPAQTIDTPVDIRVVAPTVARILRIRSPNAAALPGLVL